jgi:hypothetical protein
VNDAPALKAWLPADGAGVRIMITNGVLSRPEIQHPAKKVEYSNGNALF